MKAMLTGGWLLVLLTSFSAGAEDPWTLEVNGPVVVRSRPVPGTDVREVWAEADMEASVQDLQSTIMEASRFPSFMPYVKEVQELPSAGGARFVYARVEPPFVGARDYVLAVRLDAGVAEDGSGSFANHWVAVPNKLPLRPGCVRLSRNEGAWRVTPRSSGGAHVVYHLTVDPGGGLPSFLVNLGQKSGLLDTLKAVEREAQRRGTERAQANSAKGQPSSRRI